MKPPSRLRPTSTMACHLTPRAPVHTTISKNTPYQNLTYHDYAYRKSKEQRQGSSLASRPMPQPVPCRHHRRNSVPHRRSSHHTFRRMASFGLRGYSHRQAYGTAPRHRDCRGHRQSGCRYSGSHSRWQHRRDAAVRRLR